MKDYPKHIGLLAALFLLLSISCRQVSSPTNPIKHAEYNNAAVVTAHFEASRIGSDILKSGGNAIDAAIAVQFALAVCYPAAGNLGGGGFLVYRQNNGKAISLDFREKAPSKAQHDMYLDTMGNIIPKLSTLGHKSVGVPGTVDGMVTAFERYSKLKDWEALVSPALNLARHGFRITKQEADKLNKYKEDFVTVNTQENIFTTNTTWKEGDLLIQPQLANTLNRILLNKRAGFYEGQTAQLVLEEMQRGNGLITQSDLESYESIWRKPIITKYREFDIISMPPPSSGGLVLAQILHMLEDYNFEDYPFHTPASIHLIVEAERRAYADRATHLGDPEYYDVPVNDLLAKQYATEKMNDYSPFHATPSDKVLAGNFPVESEETTHYSIVDEYGNAVSVTTTLNTNYGSKVVVGQAGFFLNNEMDDFSAKPGAPNFYGLVGAEANKIEAGKRMLSSMTPTIIEENDKLRMVLGTPGGSTIITSVLQVFLNTLEYHMSLEEAVNAPRFHHQWLPDQISVEEGKFSPETLDALRKMGHKIKERKSIGRVEAILIENNKITAVADNRGDDCTAGY